MSLFLYCRDMGLTWLREGRLPFVGADTLLDPFVTSAAVKQPDGVVAVSEEEYRAELKSQYDALPEALSSLVTFEYFVEQAAQKRESIETQIRQRSMPDAIRLTEKQRKSLTLLSLYERVDNPVLWQYHGDNHRGVVIELDQTHSFFTSKQYRDDPQLFTPVKYLQERPLRLREVHPFSPLFTRGEQYQSEREWRIIRPVAVADKSMESNGQTLYLNKMPAAIIKSVTLGAIIDNELKQSILSLMKSDLRYRHIPVYGSYLDATQYQLHRIREN
ncbi:DUF2971 domain-containing protein [Alkalimarinus sediminis]|uniref:DUF2971 domain-containing protein n=1 Tax=Alkalimarinus sediminis TaxID=1632866 RepID=A0A9E8KN30_9ALTE|nr:DUF2971 domain-containing protein [Alkalimarinus sediminis]UZW73988.1 hypothetical protein NNL22_13240 [Alkalimarinus sediminis]